MKKFFKIIGWIFMSIIVVILLISLAAYIKSSMTLSDDMKRLGEEAPTITVDGLRFRDLNHNGKLDVYEDRRADVKARVEDLLKQMTLEEKAGLMFFTMAGLESDGSLMNKTTLFSPLSWFLESNASMVARKKMNHFNHLQAPSPQALIRWSNEIQKLAERTRLGIPVTIGTDPRHGVPNAPGLSIATPFFSPWCSAPGFAAIGDTAFMRQFGDIARQEYLSMGFRVTLSPQADLATEPRWARINGTFGEDAQLAGAMTRAYIQGFQGDTLGPWSVACMVKHFSGGGPQEDGYDAHFPPGRQAYPGNNFKYHLIPFDSAFAAHAASVMPYYGIPVGQTNEDVGFGYNKQVVTGMLRQQYGFDGVVCTDWGLVSDAKILGFILKPAAAHGVEKLSTEERVFKIIDAGCDQFGGEAIPDIIIGLVKKGRIPESRIDESARRILRDKFTLGLFENPYVDPSNASIPGRKEFVEMGKESQRRSLVLLKNDGNFLPLKPGTRIFVEGMHKGDIKPYASLIKSLEEADVIVLKVKTPTEPRTEYILERIFPEGSLEFSAKEKKKLLELVSRKPTVLVMNLERPGVFPEINAASKAVIGDFSSQDDIILDLIYGKFKPTGKLPFEIPSSMDAVLEQKEDVPYDSKKPLYPFGYGLTW
ncbi:MAG: glycoside hydrolase family 3 C-terminal domain-containing protein [Chitinophagaceae bacterium]|nr:glycoside hydrolase family 3 C-terminal domain-containing protein [Chitinophagaceae bacterium]